MPLSTTSDYQPPSLLGALRQWWRLRHAARDLRAGRGKRALQRLEGADEPEMEMRALLLSGKMGAARKTMQAALKRLEAGCGALLEAAEEQWIESWRQQPDKPVPLHLLPRLPRHQPGCFELEGLRVAFPDGPSAASAHREIFVRRLYEIPKVKSPRILDGGANIGLAAWFFGTRYEDARVTCFEADAQVAGYLRRNLAGWTGRQPEVVEAALWSSEGELKFQAEGSDAGRVDGEGGVSVPAVRLSPWLNEPVDLLKLDIEGAELEVLRECRGKLGMVRRVFVEYHSFAGREQRLDEMLALLKEAGFRVAVTVSDALSARPFVEPGLNLGMDMRLNLFGVRAEDDE